MNEEAIRDALWQAATMRINGETGIQRHFREQEESRSISGEDAIRMHALGVKWE